MATITATSPTTTVARAALVHRAVSSASPVLGLPQMRIKGGRVRCSSEEKEKEKEKEKASAAGKSTVVGESAVLAAAVSAMSGVVSSPAIALVDERLSTEGTGLSLGLSNNTLGWILLGVFGLIWSLYFVYTSTLEEDEESGLSL